MSSATTPGFGPPKPATALFIYGARDIRPHWPIEQVANLMPDARFELIKGAAHVIWSSHAGELRGLLREFVANVCGR